MVVDVAGVALLNKNIAAGTSSRESHESWCLLLMAFRYSGETELPAVSEQFSDHLEQGGGGRGMISP